MMKNSQYNKRSAVFLYETSVTHNSDVSNESTKKHKTVNNSKPSSIFFNESNARELEKLGIKLTVVDDEVLDKNEVLNNDNLNFDEIETDNKNFNF